MTMLSMLATCAKEDPLDWESHIRKVCMAYNSSVQTSTGYTPFFLMFGRLPRMPADVMFGTLPSTAESVHDYAAQLRKQMEKAFNLARQHSLSKQLRQKELYDKKVHGKPFKQGDFVWLNTPMGRRGLSKKLHHPWAGAYKVVKKLSDATYWIEQIKGRRHRKVDHFDRLELCQKKYICLEDDSQEVQKTSPQEPTQASTSAETHLITFRT